MTEDHKFDEKISLIHDHWIDPESREIWIHGIDVSGIGYDGIEPGVEYNMAVKTIKNLHYLRKQSSKANVTIHLHSSGGDWQEGMAIYDTIRLMPYPVTMICYTNAESMSSILLQAASRTKDKRLMMPNSYFMFHYMEISTVGSANSVENEIAFTKIQTEKMLNIYVESASKSEKFRNKTQSQIKKSLCNHIDKQGEVYLTAEQTVEWGFADEVLTEWPKCCKWKK